MSYEAAVNQVIVTSLATERELMYRRLKAEGARKLLLDIGKLLKV